MYKYILLMLVGACGFSSSAPQKDANALDCPRDASVVPDATIDAPIDATIDAEPFKLSCSYQVFSPAPSKFDVLVLFACNDTTKTVTVVIRAETASTQSVNMFTTVPCNETARLNGDLGSTISNITVSSPVICIKQQ